MIFKSYLLEKNVGQINKCKIFMFYGENEGLKKEFKKSGLNNIEYLEVRESKSLEKSNDIKNPKKFRVFIAVYVGGVRLIDNYKLK